MDPTAIQKISRVYRSGLGKGVSPPRAKHGSFPIWSHGDKNHTRTDLRVYLHLTTVNFSSLQVGHNFIGQRILTDSPDKAYIHPHLGQGNGGINRRPPGMHLDSGRNSLTPRQWISRD